jgi:hypothetical protein
MHQRSGWFAALGTMAALMIACLGMSPAQKQPGLGLHAGSDNNIDQYESFGDWLGREVMYRVVFCKLSHA